MCVCHPRVCVGGVGGSVCDVCACVHAYEHVCVCISLNCSGTVCSSFSHISVCILAVYINIVLWLSQYLVLVCVYICYTFNVCSLLPHTLYVKGN